MISRIGTLTKHGMTTNEIEKERMVEDLLAFEIMHEAHQAVSERDAYTSTFKQSQRPSKTLTLFHAKVKTYYTTSIPSLNNRIA